MKFNALIITLSLVFLSSLAYSLKPSREYAVTPADFGMTYNAVTFKTTDNLEIYGWLFKATAPQSRKVVILSDDGDGNMADLIEIASNFLSLGYHVLSYDYRGYGKSADFEIKENFFIYAQFQKDLESALTFITKNYPSLSTVHLYGVGVGAGLSIGIGANKSEVSRVIADSPYLTFDLTQKRYELMLGQKVLVPLGFDKTWLEPQYALAERGSGLLGILLIAGENDKIFTPADMKELAKLKKSITTVYSVKGATRENAFSMDKAAYFAEIKKFLGQ